ncbi:MAG: GNAT family N-acetyltransferase [Betaproteobacteria bacterium]|nr:GNAT family N-acetyltransferase [Betaproteobacteria bacterium]
MKSIVVDAERVGRWVCERTGGSYSEGTAIGLEEDGELIAGVLYDHYNGQSIAMHVAAAGKRWMTREYLRACFAYPFLQLRVKKILGFVDSANQEARRFDEHLGFAREATIADAGKEGDLIIYSMTPEQCRFI